MSRDRCPALSVNSRAGWAYLAYKEQRGCHGRWGLEHPACWSVGPTECHSQGCGRESYGHGITDIYAGRPETHRGSAVKKTRPTELEI